PPSSAATRRSSSLAAGFCNVSRSSSGVPSGHSHTGTSCRSRTFTFRPSPGLLSRLFPPSPGLAQVARDDTEELVDVERLGHEIVRVDPLRPLLGLRGGRQHDDRDPTAVHGPETPPEPPAIHSRHAHVEEDQIRQSRPELLERREPVLREPYAVA